MDSKNVTEVIRLCKGIAVELTNVTKEVAKNPKATIASYKHIAKFDNGNRSVFAVYI